MSEPAGQISAWISALHARGCKPKREGKGWRASCPASKHEGGNEKNPALHIEEAKGGKVLATCHAGCEFEDVRAALGLDPRPSNGTAWTPRERERSAPIRAPASRKSTPRAAPDERYEYSDAEGKALVTVCRLNARDGEPKDIWREPKGVEAPPGGYPLYRLSSLLANATKPLLVVEGEKTAECAQLLFGDHHEVTTSIGGSGSASRSDWTAAAGRKVYIWPDADAPGAKHADEVARPPLPARRRDRGRGIASGGEAGRTAAPVEAERRWPAGQEASAPVRSRPAGERGGDRGLRLYARGAAAWGALAGAGERRPSAQALPAPLPWRRRATAPRAASWPRA